MDNLQPWVFTPVVPFILGDDISQLEEIAKIRIHIKMLINNFNDLGKEVETLSVEVANNTSAIAVINTSINDIKSQIANLVNITNTHTADITELKNSVADIENSISALQNSVSALRNDLTETNRNVEQNTQSISVINDKITIIENNISIIQGNINTLNDDILRLNNITSINTQHIQNIENVLPTMQGAISTNASDIAHIKTKNDTQDRLISDNIVDITSLKYRTNTLEGRVTANDKSINDIITKTTENSNNITSINSTITNINDTLATHTEQIGNINSRLNNIPSDIGTDVSNLTAQVNTNTSNIQTLITDVATNKTNINTLNENLNNAQSSISQNAANIIADERRITTNEQNIAALQVKTENIPDDLVDSVDKNTAAIANMKSDIEQNKTNITNLETEMDTAQQDIDNNMGDITALQADMSNKVDKVTGKGLSANDFTNTDKDNLYSLWVDTNKIIVPRDTDINTIRTTGIYKLQNGANYINIPSQLGGVLQSFKYSDGYTEQIFYEFNTNKMYVRNSINDELWVNWDCYMLSSGGTFTGDITAPTANFTNLNVTNPPWADTPPVIQSFSSVMEKTALNRTITGNFYGTMVNNSLVSLNLIITSSANFFSLDSVSKLLSEQLETYLISKYEISNTDKLIATTAVINYQSGETKMGEALVTIQGVTISGKQEHSIVFKYEGDNDNPISAISFSL